MHIEILSRIQLFFGSFPPDSLRYSNRIIASSGFKMPGTPGRLLQTRSRKPALHFILGSLREHGMSLVPQGSGGRKLKPHNEKHQRFNGFRITRRRRHETDYIHLPKRWSQDIIHIYTHILYIIYSYILYCKWPKVQEGLKCCHNVLRHKKRKKDSLDRGPFST